MECRRCGEDKPEDDFYRRSDIARGRSPWCKDCHRAREAERKRPHRESDPMKHRARARAQYALKVGRLRREPCETCGDPDAEMHHDDYSRPLDVRWKCRSCHRQHHADEAVRPTM